MATHDKVTFVREYCLCRRIPYRFVGNFGQLIIGNSNVGADCIYSVYNLPYSELVSTIDSMVQYDEYGWFAGLK